MEEICCGEFAPRRGEILRCKRIRAVSWNIDRGLRVDAVADFLAHQRADLVLLQEVDINARRTHCINIAEELARRLEMNYVFGREFEELAQQTNNGRAFHGQATLSRCAQRNARLIRFRRQSGFWRPRWFVPLADPFQRRLGGRIALVSEMEMSEDKRLSVYNMHLESRGPDELRFAQLEEAVHDAAKHDGPQGAVFGGDLNFNVTSHKRAAALIEQAGLRDVLGSCSAQTTTRGLWKRGRSIDWSFVAGPLRAVDGQVHGGIEVSDHYPMSFTLLTDP